MTGSAFQSGSDDPPREPCAAISRDGLSQAQERAILTRAMGRYRAGWFPMGDEFDGRIEWVRPRRRAVMRLVDFHAGRTLERVLKESRFRITSDTAFDDVVRQCAEPRPGREQTWLLPPVMHLFRAFHGAGLAHSVEAWLDGEAGPVLVGGLYGLRMGRIFAGESMFSAPERGGTDASKVCLAHAVCHLIRRGFVLFDAQLQNDHIARFGFREIPDSEYREMLSTLVETEVAWGPFDARWERLKNPAR